MTFKPMDVTIDKVCRRDLTALGEIFAHSFRDEVHPEHIKHRIRRINQFYYLLRPFARISPWIKDLFNFYVIKVRGEMAGFLQVSYLNHQRQLHLDYIAISKRFQGQGLGTWVMRKFIQKVADLGNQDIVLEVKSDNPAHHLYKRLGFSTRLRILHYERTFGYTNIASASPVVSGLRKVRDADRSQLYALYLSSVPGYIRAAIPRDYRFFNPSLFVRHLSLLKNRLMKTNKKEYIVERDKSIIALLEIISYPAMRHHIISLMVHPDHENLRASLIKHTLFTLRKQYGYGTISTTIYDDTVIKQLALEKLRFKRVATYHLMLRPAHLKLKRPDCLSYNRYQPPEGKQSKAVATSCTYAL